MSKLSKNNQTTMDLVISQINRMDDESKFGTQKSIWNNGFTIPNYNYGYVDSIGIIRGKGTDQNWIHTDYILLSPDSSINYNIKTNNATVAVLSFYDINKIYISSIMGLSSGQTNGTFNLSSNQNIKYVIACGAASSVEDSTSYFSLTALQLIDNVITKLNYNNYNKSFKKPTPIISIGGACNGFSYIDSSNSVSGLLKIRPLTDGQTSLYFIAYTTSKAIEICTVSSSMYYYPFACDNKFIYCINNNGSLFAFRLTNGEVLPFVSMRSVAVNGSISRNRTTNDLTIINRSTPNGCSLYFINPINQTEEFWVNIIFFENVYLSCASIVHGTVVASRWDSTVLYLKTIDDNSLKIDDTTIEYSSTYEHLLVITKEVYGKISKVSKSDFIKNISYNIFYNKKILLYGDSRMSTDYSFNKTELKNITKSLEVYNGGYSGYSAAALASNTCLSIITTYNPDILIILLGGNEQGLLGSIGTFSDSSILYETGEQIVSETDYTQEYNGTFFIQAISHIMRRLNSLYSDFRANANLTGLETETERDAKIEAVKKPILLFCTDIPQKRDNENSGWSNKDNWERKRQAILECSVKYKFHCLDLCNIISNSIDLSKEPYWTSPTDKINNKGLYYMDGLHLNKYGWRYLSHVIKNHILSIGSPSL